MKLARLAGFFAACALGLLAPLAQPSARADVKTYDVVVYGGTSGGVIAAVNAARMGKSVVLIEPGRRLGGLSSGGLGATDIGNKAAIGGMSRDFYRALGKHYGQEEAWKFEPHVAEKVFDDLAAEAKVPVMKGQRLDLKNGVKKEGNRIVSITMESGETYGGKVFIDATYEGDLMAKAGVSYKVGREGKDEYGETLNGVQLNRSGHQGRKPISAYVKPDDPESGLLPGVHGGSPGEQGQGDERVQAYNFRLCLTDVPANRVPFPRPDGYDPMRYELLRRYIDAGVFDVFGNHQAMPNHKTDMNNNGAFASDNIGMNYAYPDGDYAAREKIFNEHKSYQQGLMWFLANDPRLPESVRDATSKWGLCKDEFQDTGGWGHQLYIREARRMVGQYVMTQHNCQGEEVAPDPIGLGAYNMDSHNTQRYVDKDGHARNEGDVQVGVSPYPIAYGAIVPKEAECANLLVPVCLSSTHIAYGSIRMEPVFMALGQTVATAACDAIDAGVAVQKVDYAKLREQLLADKQVLEWTGPKTGAGASTTRPGASIDAASLPGIVVDNPAAKLIGNWTPSRVTGGYVGDGYLHDGNAGKGKKSARFEVPIRDAGRYRVSISYSPLANRAANVPVTVTGFTDAGAAAGTKQFRVDQRQAPEIDGTFHPLGTFPFAAASTAVIEIGGDGTNGHVIVDAVQLLAEK